MNRLVARSASCTLWILVLILAVVFVSASPSEALASGRSDSIGDSASDQSASVALCRYGVDAIGSMDTYPVEDLRIGWYIDFGLGGTSLGSGSVEYMPMIRLKKSISGEYMIANTTLEAVATEAAVNPGQTWIIGNEPDSPYQDKLEAELYAEAYHDLYYAIKSADPTAQIATAGVVQPTPVRLYYLDLVLESYLQAYGEPMPVDVWNIHVYILHERNCDVYYWDCWGAEIPPGIDWPEGELYSIDDNANFEIFRGLVQDFRDWMASRGYRDRPLIITEFGVQMPADVGSGFPPDLVNAFMDDTFDFLASASGPNGYPADGNRLVQRWAWWSLQRPPEYVDSNGWLYDPGTPPVRTVFGDNYAGYTAQVQPNANLFPVKVWTEPAVIFSPTDPVTVTLFAKVANDGEVSMAGTSVAQFYQGVAPDASEQIGPDLLLPDLGGCGDSTVISVTLSNLSSGAHPVYVVVDPDGAITENNEDDNVMARVVFVNPHRVFLPLVSRD